MSRSILLSVLAASFLSIAATTATTASAASKEECLDAHSRGQDLREKGLLTRARATFLTCAQSSCPNLIQGDCAKYAEELDRLVPSVSFSARDARSGDLPNTTVYVDDVLIANRLDDGKSYDFDPGKHVIRYVHDGKETVLKVVLNQGDKGRTLVATFASENAPVPASADDARALPPQPKRPAFPLVVAGLGAAALVTGGVLMAIGMHDVPSNCSMSTKECAAAPGDKSFDEASKGVGMANLGLGVGLGGAAVLVGGLIWYFTQSPTPPSTSAALKTPLLAPWVGREAGGVMMTRSF